MGYASQAVKLYLVTNKSNNKTYAGVTHYKNVSRRFSEHWYAAHKKVHNGAFYRALLKYPRESFEIKVISEHATRQEAYDAEIAYIAAHKPEYNSTLGGAGQKGRVASLKIKETNKLIHTGNKYRAGKTHTSETRQILKEKAIENIEIFKMYQKLGPQKSSKPVICLNDGLCYPSASAAARHYKVARSALIELCLGKNYRQTVNGLRFKYQDAA